MTPRLHHETLDKYNVEGIFICLKMEDCSICILKSFRLYRAGIKIFVLVFVNLEN